MWITILGLITSVLMLVQSIGRFFLGLNGSMPGR